MTDFREHADSYLSLRRSLGFKLRLHEMLLNGFCRYLERTGEKTLTNELAMAWAMQPTGVHPYTWKIRLSVVRGFARYLQTFAPETQVPPADLLAYRYRRPVAFIYSEDEIRSIMSAASVLKPQFRAETYRILLGLLAVTGMRLCEALNLDRTDIDLASGRLTIHLSKFSKSRELPLHLSTTQALTAYAQQRDQLYPSATPNPSFFVSTRGTRLIDAVVHRVFRKLIADIGLEPRAGSGVPRIHDMSYPNLNKIQTFSVNRCYFSN